MSRFLKGALCAAIALLATTASAGSVYLNGVLVDGLTGQKFDRVQSVRFDDQGNVWIDAPAYKVEVQQPATPPAAPTQAPAAVAPAPAQPAPIAVPQPAPAQPIAQPQVPVAAPPVAVPAPTVPARITQRYWLVTQQNAPGVTQYDIDVYVNSKWIRRLKNDDDQTIAEITGYLKPGANKVMLSAHKNIEGGVRKSYSADQFYRVVVGTGNVGGDKVLIDTALVDFSRTAAQTDDVSQDFTINAQ